MICLPKTCPSHVSLLFAFPSSTISYDHSADVMICRYGPELHKLPGPDCRQLMMSIRIVKNRKTFPLSNFTVTGTNLRALHERSCYMACVIWQRLASSFGLNSCENVRHCLSIAICCFAWDSCLAVSCCRGKGKSNDGSLRQHSMAAGRCCGGVAHALSSSSATCSLGVSRKKTSLSHSLRHCRVEYAAINLW